MRLQHVYHESRLFTALTISHKTLPLPKQQPELVLFLLNMAPRTFYAKSQEVVYKKTGSSARPKFKGTHVKVSLSKNSSKIHRPEPPEPSVVLPPDGADNPSQLDPGESSSFLDYEIPQ